MSTRERFPHPYKNGLFLSLTDVGYLLAVGLGGYKWYHRHRMVWVWAVTNGIIDTGWCASEDTL